MTLLYTSILRIITWSGSIDYIMTDAWPISRMTFFLFAGTYLDLEFKRIRSLAVDGVQPHRDHRWEGYFFSIFLKLEIRLGVLARSHCTSISYTYRTHSTEARGTIDISSY
jgi:hypothetical protein